MKYPVLLILAMLSGSVALAQQAPAPRAPAPPRAAPAGAPASAVVGAPGATNAANPWMELRDIQAKLHPFELKLMESDPDVKALVLKHKALQDALLDVDKKRLDKISEKLAADPATAALEARRKELTKKIGDARSAATPGAKTDAKPNAPAPRPPVTVTAP